MTKQPITYMGLVKVSLKKLIANGVDRKEAFRQTAKRWRSIKQGSDSEFSHDTSKQPSTRKSKKSKSTTLRKNSVKKRKTSKLRNLPPIGFEPTLLKSSRRTKSTIRGGVRNMPH